MLVQSLISVASARRLSLVAAAAFAPLMATPDTWAQAPEGVVFVEDIEEQVRRQQAAGPWAPAPARAATPAPRPMAPSSVGQRPVQYPTPQTATRGQMTQQTPAQPQARVAQGAAPQARGMQPAQPMQAAEEPKSSWRDKFAFKNPFSKIFGSREQTEGAEPQVDRTPPRAMASSGLQQRPHQSRAQGMMPQERNQLASTVTNPRLQAPSRGSNQQPAFDPFRGERPVHPQAATGMPLASAQSTLPGSHPLAADVAPRTSPTAPNVRQVAHADDLDDVVMVSDLDTTMLGNLPSIEGPTPRAQEQLPQVVATPTPRTTPAYQGTDIGPALADTSSPAGERPVVQAHAMPEADMSNMASGVANAVAEQVAPTQGSQEIVNNHVQLATSSVEFRPASRPTPPYPATAINGGRPSASIGSNADAARARRAVPAEGPKVVDNPVTAQGPDAQPSRDKAVEYLTRASKLSQTAASEEEYTQVLQLCRSALAIDNSENVQRYSNELASWALNRRGEAKSDRGESREAMLDFEDALRLDPKRWRAIHNRGVIAAQEGRFAEAFDDFNLTLELNPKFAKAYSNRAALFVQAGDLQSALDDYQQAITFDPELAIAHKGRAKICHLIGDFDGALRHFDAAMLLAPEDATIVNYRGDLQCDIGRYSDAARSYRQAIELDPNLADAYRNLAWLAATCPNQELRNPQAAMALAHKMMELTPQPGDLEHDTLAAAYAISGDYPRALAEMDKAIQLSPPEGVENYKWRRKLYEQQRPYITEPTGSVEVSTGN